MKALYREYYRTLRLNYGRYCQVDEPHYCFHDNLMDHIKTEVCPVKRAAGKSWLARID